MQRTIGKFKSKQYVSSMAKSVHLIGKTNAVLL